MDRSDAAAEQPISPAFRQRYIALADATGRMRFDAFMQLALYDEGVGYYRRQRRRVGRVRGTDFFTAASLGPLFGELVTSACESSLRPSGGLSDYTFVEIGAEPETSVLDGVAHPFGAVRTLRVGEPLQLDGRCVVFSNELFDAQPFRRFISGVDGWSELGVSLQNDRLIECEWSPAPPEMESLLPKSCAPGYRFDAPIAAAELTALLAKQPWSGAFIAFDYGKSLQELLEATPTGTARAYFQHRQEKDLLIRPGEQDLTCHVCWDWLVKALADQNFGEPLVESQEAFFMTRAAGRIAEIVTAEAAKFSQRKMALMQLLHPGNMGQKFQALWATRM